MKPKQQKAFTLIELLVVIAIIGILSTLAVVSLQNARKSARDAKRVSDIKQIQTALELYYNDEGKYPASIQEDLAIYLPNFPQAPTPADGDCNKDNNRYDYQQESDGSAYSLTFCLGSKTGELDEGPKTAGVGGIYSLGAYAACSDDTVCGDTCSYGGTNYPTVQIGDQCWMKKNLNVGTMISCESPAEYMEMQSVWIDEDGTHSEPYYECCPQEKKMRKDYGDGTYYDYCDKDCPASAEKTELFFEYNGVQYSQYSCCVDGEVERGYEEGGYWDYCVEYSDMIGYEKNQSNNSIIEKFCYDNNVSNCNVYGGLYQWNEAMKYTTVEGSQGICPAGWHIPSYDEWLGLMGYLENNYQYKCLYEESGYHYYLGVGKSLAATSGWGLSEEVCAIGNNLASNNSTGFSALPAGSYEGHFHGLSSDAYWWSSSANGDSINIVYLHYKWESPAFYGYGHDEFYYRLSLRCLQN